MYKRQLVKNAGGVIKTINLSKSNSSKDYEVSLLKSSSELSSDTITVAASEHLIDQVVELIINSQIDC